LLSYKQFEENKQNEMTENNHENDVLAKNSFYHFIFKKSIDWLIISGAVYLVWPYLSSKNLYFLAGKLLLVFCMVELIRRYFLTWNKLRTYYNTRERLRKYSNKEIPDEEEAIGNEIENDEDTTLEKLGSELNHLVMKSYEKEYKDLNDYYEHERAEFSSLLSLWKEDPRSLHTSFEGYLSFITSVLNLKEIPGDEKRNYKRISGILLIVLLSVILDYVELWLLRDIL
jgi:hypothetical protein